MIWMDLSTAAVTMRECLSKVYWTFSESCYRSTGSAALYQQNFRPGIRPGASAPDGRMNGLHGPKHKREMDRECKLFSWHRLTSIDWPILSVNRFTGTRLEDLQGEIATLCKDQHGCRYLQKKLEEGLPEHRDMIFRETFNHFAELMIGTFSIIEDFVDLSLSRSIWQLSLPETFGVRHRWTA